MLALLSCPQGHFWEAVNGEDNDSSGNPVCPTCGAPAESLPLLDLAPSEPAGAEEAPAPPPPPPLRDDKGRPVVAGYEVSEEVDRGPTGVAFYRARQVLVNRPVLLKVVFAREDPGQVAWGSLRGEAAALGRVAHPNIVQIFEAGERDRQLFYNAVELVEGPTLAALTAHKPLPPRQAVGLVESLARAVHHAHEKGVVHRSLKPASILLQPVSRGDPAKDPAAPPAPPYCQVRNSLCLPKITDWGLARRPVEGDVNDAELQGEQPDYLSPEQAWGRAKEIGPLTDVYALGAILYELLAGRPPFREATPSQTLDAIQCRDPLLPSRWQRVPADLDAVCRRCLAKQPRRRYASALELAEDLQRWLTGYPVQARPHSLTRRAVRWVRRNARGIGAGLLGMFACWVLMTASGPPPRHPATVPARVYGGLKSMEPVQPNFAQTMQREQEAHYLRRITLADRALEERDSQRARDLLEGCPNNQRRWEWYHLKHRLDGQNIAAEIRGPARVTQVAFSPDGRLLALCGEELGKDKRGQVAVWGLGNLDRVLDVPNAAGPVRGFAFSPDGFRLALLLDEGQGTELRFLDVRTGRRITARRFVSRLTDVAYSPDGARLLVAEEGGTLRLLMANNGTDLWAQILNANQPWLRLQGPYGRVVATTPDAGRFTAVSPDGRQLVLNGSWQGEPPTGLGGHTDIILALAVHPAMNRLATGSRDRTARVWPVLGGQPLELRGHRDAVTGVAWSPDGTRLATSSSDGTVKVWDPLTGLEIVTLKGLAGEARAVAWSPDGSRLAAAHGDRVTVWKGQVPAHLRNNN